jgi:hypothetical protein
MFRVITGSGKHPMAGTVVESDVAATMKASVVVAITVSVLLASCTQERDPYSETDVTNNAPRAEPAYTNPVPVPTSDRTNPRIDATNSSAQKP